MMMMISGSEVNVVAPVAAIDEHVKWTPNGAGRRTGVDVVAWQHRQQQHHIVTGCLSADDL